MTTISTVPTRAQIQIFLRAAVQNVRHNRADLAYIQITLLLDDLHAFAVEDRAALDRDPSIRRYAELPVNTDEGAY